MYPPSGILTLTYLRFTIRSIRDGSRAELRCELRKSTKGVLGSEKKEKQDTSPPHKQNDPNLLVNSRGKHSYPWNLAKI